MGTLGSREGTFINKLMGIVGLLNIGRVTTVTNTYTILQTDRLIICNKASAFTLTLPVTMIGRKYSIKNIGAGTVTIDGAGSDTIDGAFTKTVVTDACINIVCYLANKWVVVSDF